MKIRLTKLKKILQFKYLYYLLLLFSFIYIAIYNQFYTPKYKYNINDNNFILEIKSYKIDGDKLTIEFKESLIGNYYFKTKTEKDNFNYKIGDKIYVCGKLKEPNTSTIFNAFDYKKYLNNKNIFYILSIDKFNLYKENTNIFNKIKNSIYNRISKIKYNSYLYAFILGKSDYIDDSIYNNYKINGITHLFALSGLHVSLFSSILLYILNKFKINKKLSFLIVSLFLIFFAFIASFTPSILRAVIFFIISNINKIYKLNIKTKYLLYTTFFILILINPKYIFNTGFILSFTITFFIILFNENYKIKNKILNLLIISFISFISSFPIIINMSYEINIIGFLNNLFFIPYVSYLVFPLSILTLIFPFLSNILNIFIVIMEYISNISSTILNINLYFMRINVFEIIIYYVLFILIIKKHIKLIIPFIIFLIYLYIKPLIYNNDNMYILDVGQGDSILLKIDNKSILIDTGGKPNFKKDLWTKRDSEYNVMISSIIPFFKSIGIKKIDYLIITHGDYDHIGNASKLINNFKIDAVIFNVGDYNKLELNLIKILKEKHIPYYQNIESLNINNNKLYFLNTRVYDNENDNSSVIYTKINNKKILLMGDAGKAKELDIINKYNIKDIDILKVGHHGSNTSSSIEFIDVIKPKKCIISVGKNNHFGHPKESVIDTLTNYCDIYRTDVNGSISIN